MARFQGYDSGNSCRGAEKQHTGHVTSRHSMVALKGPVDMPCCIHTNSIEAILVDMVTPLEVTMEQWTGVVILMS